MRITKAVAVLFLAALLTAGMTAAQEKKATTVDELAKMYDALKQQGRSLTTEGRGGLGTALVIAQVALSLVLVVAAGLFVRTFATLATGGLLSPSGADDKKGTEVKVGGLRATAPADWKSQKPANESPLLLSRSTPA